MTWRSCRRPPAARAGGLAAILAVAAAAVLVPAARAAAGDDDLLAAARKYVDGSDRYLHHSKLRRGMKGYGLSVFTGVKIARFNVEIVSVVERWGPHQAVVLALLSGQDLHISGVVAGMSGSPIFVRHEGKDKMIGALAYGWSSQKRALCGVQPITQMLAIKGVLDSVRKPSKKAPKKAAAPGGAAPLAARADPEYLRAVLDPAKRDFSQLGWPKRMLRPAAPRLLAGQRGGLEPLATPLMVSGIGNRAMAELALRLEPAGLVPLQGGGAGKMQRDAAMASKFAPGSAVSVPLATGDADMSATGTVTEVVGNRVLVFGHSMFGEGPISLPMGPAYVHTVVASLMRSFKLSSGFGVTGVLNQDEYVGVAGVIGAKATMIPLTVTVEYPRLKRRRVYRYQVARHRWMTPSLVRSLILEAGWGWRELPRHHTVKHEVTVDFGPLGRYRATDVSSDGDLYGVSSDVTRPISALLNNPFGPPAHAKRIDVRISIEPADRSARVLRFELAGRTYRPGEKVTGHVTVRPFRTQRHRIPVEMDLPANLPEGTYFLRVCDASTAISQLQSEMPHRFSPRTVPQLFEAIRRTVDRDSGRLYLRLRLPQGGLAVDKKELTHLPDSKARILAEAEILDTRRFSISLSSSMHTQYVISGSATASFQVRRKPKEILIRKQRK